jgi:hypothetical protein
MGRPSEIHISIAARDGQIQNVRVGGKAVLAGEGTNRMTSPERLIDSLESRKKCDI